MSVAAVMTLLSLFASSFLAATLLPGGSELVFYAVLAADHGLYWPALAVATIGNTLGGLTSYMLGRLLPVPEPVPEQRPARSGRRALAWLKAHGSAVLVLAWLPVLGDALCVAAGWHRLHPVPVTVFMALGKFARYWVIAQGTIS